MEEPDNITAIDPGNAAGCDGDIPSDGITTPLATHAEPLTSQKLLEHTDHGKSSESVRHTAHDSGYNSSGSSAPKSPSEKLNDGVEDGEQIQTRSRASSRTSISSIPASVLTNLPDGLNSMNGRDGQDYMYQPWEHQGARSVHTLRQREALFRKPSSVRAMQMHTEDEADDDFLTPPRRRGSHISVRSAGSSPFKRSPFYPPTSATSKPKAKKEYPLVLLHCTLLPPTLPVPGLVGHVYRQEILREVLPAVYWKRWKLLEDKIGSGVLRDRGVLISHPEDIYDLLEERLLESLELQHPRLDHGHFLGRTETDSDGEEEQLAREDSGTEDEGEECPDCGGRVVRHDMARKWEVKVFAANGMLKAGAWAAAWKEMEKVDVEVGMWLPADIRADLERRLAEDSPHIDNGLPTLLQGQENLLVGPPVRAPTPSPQITEPEPRVTAVRNSSLSPTPSSVRSQGERSWNPPAYKPSEDIDLHTLLVNYIRVLASDRRNVAIVFLSVLVIFVAINSRSVQPLSNLRPYPRDIPEYIASTMVPQQQHATQTWTENTSAQTAPVASLDTIAKVKPTPIPEALSTLHDFSDAQLESPLPKLEDVSRTAELPSLQATTHSTPEEESKPISASEFELEDFPATTAEIPTAGNMDPSSGAAEEFTETSETVSFEEPHSSVTSLVGTGDDHVVPAYGQREPPKLDEPSHQLEENEPIVPMDEQNEQMEGLFDEDEDNEEDDRHDT
ncbi:hypothetical protein BJY04DRAFT_82169 [Aspergillus karnatakaensis]|uniref:uncharacterized protein n=1 Tax=Aspergillus karnatakaensis TaxID=1810916 RepID=UPI003CCD6145